VVLFSSTQNIGGLAGSALLGSYQAIATKAHLAALSEHLVATDPQVVARIQAQGAARLFQAATREATILAFNDVFRFVALLAVAVALFLCCLVLRDLLRGRFRVTRQVSA
jgi:hypothetical protein